MNAWYEILNLILIPFRWVVSLVMTPIAGISVGSIIIAFIIIGMVIRALINNVPTMGGQALDRAQREKDKEEK